MAMGAEQKGFHDIRLITAAEMVIAGTLEAALYLQIIGHLQQIR